MALLKTHSCPALPFPPPLPAPQEGGWVLTVGFTLLFTALSALCAAYVVKAIQFYRARQAERRKLRTPETGRTASGTSVGGGSTSGGVESVPPTDEGQLLEFELLVRVTTTRPWWVVFQVRARRK